jgi:hypothetical protein
LKARPAASPCSPFCLELRSRHCLSVYTGEGGFGNHAHPLSRMPKALLPPKPFDKGGN